MDNPLDKHLEFNLTGGVKVSSTFRSAFGDFFNLFMIFSLSLPTIVFSLILINSGFNLVLMFIVFTTTTFLILYIWAILTRILEIRNDGVRYEEAFRKVFFAWEDIQMIRGEPDKGQLTFWLKDRPKRIHTFGLNRTQLPVVIEALFDQTEVHKIDYELIFDGHIYKRDFD